RARRRVDVFGQPAEVNRVHGLQYLTSGRGAGPRARRHKCSGRIRGVVGTQTYGLVVSGLRSRILVESVADLTQVEVRLGPLRVDFDGPLEGGGGLRVLAPPTERDPEGVVRFDVFFVETDGLLVSVDGVGPAPQLRVNVAEAVM